MQPIDLMNKINVKFYDTKFRSIGKTVMCTVKNQITFIRPNHFIKKEEKKRWR